MHPAQAAWSRARPTHSKRGHAAASRTRARWSRRLAPLAHVAWSPRSLPCTSSVVALPKRHVGTPPQPLAQAARPAPRPLAAHVGTPRSPSQEARSRPRGPLAPRGQSRGWPAHGQHGQAPRPPCAGTVVTPRSPSRRQRGQRPLHTPRGRASQRPNGHAPRPPRTRSLVMTGHALAARLHFATSHTSGVAPRGKPRARSVVLRQASHRQRGFASRHSHEGESRRWGFGAQAYGTVAWREHHSSWARLRRRMPATCLSSEKAAASTTTLKTIWIITSPRPIWPSACTSPKPTVTSVETAK